MLTFGGITSEREKRADFEAQVALTLDAALAMLLPRHLGRIKITHNAAISPNANTTSDRVR